MGKLGEIFSFLEETVISEMLSHKLIVYYTIVILIGIFVFLRVRKFLNEVHGKRHDIIDKLNVLDAVRTRFPGKSKRNLKKSAFESLKSRFTILNRGFFFLFIIIWGVLLALPFLGSIPTTFISLLATVIAVIIGIAARPYLENMIAGIVITFSRQIHAGDTITIDGEYGTVEDISITHSVLKLWDWRRYVVPNSQMLNKVLVNYTTKDAFLWSHIPFWVSYETDLEKLEQIALDIAASSFYVVHNTTPKFWIMEMDKESIQCWLVAWTRTPNDSWYFRIEVRKKLIQELKNAGIKTHIYYQNLSNDAYPPDI